MSETGLPESGLPETGVPETCVPETGVPETVVHDRYCSCMEGDPCSCTTIVHENGPRTRPYCSLLVVTDRGHTDVRHRHCRIDNDRNNNILY